MISKKKYHAMISELPRHKLSSSFHMKVMESLEIKQIKKHSSRPVYLAASIVLSILLVLMVSISPHAARSTYTQFGKNAMSLGSKLSALIQSAPMSQR